MHFAVILFLRFPFFKKKIIVCLSLLCLFDPNFVCCYTDDNRGSKSFKEKEMWLEWILRLAKRTKRKPLGAVEK